MANIVTYVDGGFVYKHFKWTSQIFHTSLILLVTKLNDWEMESSSERACVLVVMDANRSKSGVEALEWALKSVVHPKDTDIALGVLIECWRKNSCFPFLTGIGISGWCKLGLCHLLTYNISISNNYLMNPIYAFSDSFSHSLCIPSRMGLAPCNREATYKSFFFFFFWGKATYKRCMRYFLFYNVWNSYFVWDLHAIKKNDIYI